MNEAVHVKALQPLGIERQAKRRPLSNVQKPYKSHTQPRTVREMYNLASAPSISTPQNHRRHPLRRSPSYCTRSLLLLLTPPPSAPVVPAAAFPLPSRSSTRLPCSLRSSSQPPNPAPLSLLSLDGPTPPPSPSPSPSSSS